MKTTKELLNQIKHITRKEFVDVFDGKSCEIDKYLNSILKEKNVEIKCAIRDLMLDRSYGYQIFNGRRKPTRLILIRFALFYGLNLEETQRLLRMGQKAELYPKIRFDAAVIWGIEHQLTLEACEELLQEIGEKSLFEG